MWLFTTQGFYSVVAHRDDPNRVIVRARAAISRRYSREYLGVDRVPLWGDHADAPERP